MEPLKASPDEPIAEAAKHMVARGVGAVLVMEGDRLEGILTERDILKAVARGVAESAHVRDWMTPTRRRWNRPTRPATPPPS